MWPFCSITGMKILTIRTEIPFLFFLLFASVCPSPTGGRDLVRHVKCKCHQSCSMIDQPSWTFSVSSMVLCVEHENSCRNMRSYAWTQKAWTQNPKKHIHALLYRLYWKCDLTQDWTLTEKPNKKTEAWVCQVSRSPMHTCLRFSHLFCI